MKGEAWQTTRHPATQTADKNVSFMSVNKLVVDVDTDCVYIDP